MALFSRIVTKENNMIMEINEDSPDRVVIQFDLSGERLKEFDQMVELSKTSSRKQLLEDSLTLMELCLRQVSEGVILGFHNPVKKNSFRKLIFKPLVNVEPK